ncbi:phosphate/phosphite/phosphonate ABC transporter substrate-binding protein [Fictibacillus phosphorivorans]|uniref:phosphate/phosphite/phosphonate ABC transporter substrate-binding protein n=1 Tax=Fictibacillus phosphorivorans TaxID=1221500 RepID=UPI002041B455|nr:phosphate/phosphite/phosphonate ABC transporter substrate-binding protein [Fictibacillus phosphorivorans]MCM3717042.1 phosphate/phosphite/phosphonate ABC transporter substrate-binding protein [Fictibacillus phosphorivorans]MCM3774729.1 phosphate/phosphite/phosphonate ABC transporter substrate-binding protein [Fictibacillus phosphorivorans]
MKKIGLLFVILALLLAACGKKEEKKDAGKKDNVFTIGVVPAQTEGEMKGALDKLQSILSEKMDREVKITSYPDYNGVVEAMNYDKIDMAYFGPLTYVVAQEKSGAKAIVTQLIKGEPYYYAYLITHKDSKYESIDDMIKDAKNVRFAFGDPSSTSGSLIPGIKLKDEGVYKSEADNEFKNVRFTGSHDATALAVQNKQVDVGAIDSAIYDKLVEEGTVDGKQFKVIWKSEKLFQYPWAVSKNTDKETIKELQDIFLDIKDKEILDAFGATGFTKAENKDYESIRKAAIKEGMIKE